MKMGYLGKIKKIKNTDINKIFTVLMEKLDTSFIKKE